MTKVPESQRKATERYRQKNRKKTTIDNYKRSAKLFIRNHADQDALSELKQLIKEREISMLNIKIKVGKIKYVGNPTDVFNSLFADDIITEEQLNELHQATDPIKAWNDLDVHIGDLGVEFDVDFGGDVEKDFVKVDSLDEVEELKALDIIDGDSSTTILI